MSQPLLPTRTRLARLPVPRPSDRKAPVRWASRWVHTCAIAGLVSLAFPGYALALHAGDDILSLGVAAIQPDATLGPATSTGPLATAFNAATAGASADVSRETTASFSWLHLFTDHLGAEFTLGVPPKHEVDLRTPSPFAAAAFHPRAATLRTWTPAAVGKWFLGDPSQHLRPYLGLGVSYVSFHEVDINRNDPTVVLLAGQDASVRSDWTPVYNLGALWEFKDRWSLNGSVSYLPIRSEVEFVGSGGTRTRGDLKLNTTDWVLRLGYRF